MAGSSSVRPYVAGAAVLAVAMGFGRFAYTPLLVVMRSDAGLSVALAGALASANLAGYLLGALFAMHPASRSYRRSLVIVGVVAVAALTGMMALPAWTWFFARFATGVASGVVFVLTVSLILDEIARSRSRDGVAILFTGIGAGIATVGILVPLFASIGGSRAAWVGLALVAFAVLLVAIPSLPASQPAIKTSTAGGSLDTKGMFWRLAFLYTIEGASYIVPATFLVAMVTETHGLARYSGATWVLVGLVAIPSALIWTRLAQRWGTAPAFLATLVVQAVSMTMPFIFGGAAGVALVAVGLGGTFMGATLLGMSLARTMRPANSTYVVGLLTVLYGIGQICGPLVATRVALATGSYRGALLIAATTLGVGIAIFATGIARPSAFRTPMGAAPVEVAK